MPGRKIILANNQIYHILNRGVAAQPVFLDKRDYKRALDLLFYYQNANPPLKYSEFSKLSLLRRTELLEKLRVERKFLVEIIAFCLMPNHIHLLVEQTRDNGISSFMSNFTNSYTRYFNSRRKRYGHIFQGKFKAVRIETDEQLVHISRYIHLNPYTSFLVKTYEELEQYPYSSFSEYLLPKMSSFCNKKQILSHFDRKQTYRTFVANQADYQRKLEIIKHLLLKK